MKVLPRLEPVISARRIGLNTLALWSEMAVTLGLMLILARVMLEGLGKSGFGLWGIALGAVEMVMALDLGLRIASFRFMSRALVDKSRSNAFRVVNNAFLTMLPLVVILVGVVLVIAWALPLAWSAKRSVVEIALFRQTMWILAATVPLSLLQNPFLSVLVGLQRSYLMSIGRLAGQLVFAAWILFLVNRQAMDLRWVAAGMCANYAAAFVLAVTMAVVCLGKFPISLRRFRWPQAKEMLLFGRGVLVMGLSHMLIYGPDLVLIGTFLTSEFAAMYRIPLMIVKQTQVLAAVSTPLLAVAAQLHKRGEHGLLRELFHSSTRITGLLAMCLLGPLVMFGEVFIELWLPGEEMAWTWKLLGILAIGQWVMLATFPAERMLMGTGRIKLTSIAFGTAGICKVIAGAIFLSIAAQTDMAWGLYGLAWVTSVLLVAVKGVIVPAYICRQNEMSFSRFMLSTFGRLGMSGVVAASAMLAMRFLWTPQTLAMSLVQLAAGAGLCLAIGTAVVLTSQDRTYIRSMILRRT